MPESLGTNSIVTPLYPNLLGGDRKRKEGGEVEGVLCNLGNWLS